MRQLAHTLSILPASYTVLDFNFSENPTIVTFFSRRLVFSFGVFTSSVNFFDSSGFNSINSGSEIIQIRDLAGLGLRSLQIPTADWFTRELFIGKADTIRSRTIIDLRYPSMDIPTINYRPRNGD